MDAKSLRIVFMGTPEFASTSLRRLVAEGYNIVAVVTTPDKPAGRGQKMHQSDVKLTAEQLGLPILQPEKLRDDSFLASLRALNPDLGVVIAFRMLPEVVWAMPKYGTFNLHASLLPQYRGAAPINWAIINGDTETGVTTFLLNEEIDKGAIIEQRKVDILPEDNIGTLYDRLMVVGAELVSHTVDKIALGEYQTIEQMHIDENTLRPAPKIFKEDGRIDWHSGVVAIHNRVRGLSPYPAAWTPIYKCGEECGSAKIFTTHIEKQSMSVAVGTLRSDGRSYLAVAASDGWVYIDEIQLAGKRRMAVKDLLLGWRDYAEVTFCL
ncbi:MAG: methionyl-tRNA formyltransferase [Rikenellaceae bacterium]|nr:methionyl-tRNA formyltransferase [Rikenellaceae bacterium]